MLQRQKLHQVSSTRVRKLIQDNFKQNQVWCLIIKDCTCSFLVFCDSHNFCFTANWLSLKIFAARLIKLKFLQHIFFVEYPKILTNWSDLKFKKSCSTKVENTIYLKILCHLVLENKCFFLSQIQRFFLNKELKVYKDKKSFMSLIHCYILRYIV